jgi:DNA-binding PadR family transcriptional regulator
MDTSLHTETVLLVEMLRGPGYGLDLIERVRLRSGGRIRLRQGAVYPALRDLCRRNLLRSWIVTTPGSGRPRTYQELTPEGLALAQAHRDTITRFAAEAAPLRPTRRVLEEMRQRLFRCGEVAEAAMWLRRAGKAVGL